MCKTNRRPRWQLALLLVLCAVLLSGCWDTKDINRRALPVALGVDIGEEGEYVVYLKVPSLIRGGSSFVVMKRTSLSISKAIDLMARDLDRSIELLHVKLILISDKAAEQGLGEVIDFCMRTREIGAKTLLALAQGDLGDVIGASEKLGNIGAAYQNFFSPSAGWTPEVSRAYLYQAFRDLHAHTEDMALPILKKGTETTFRFGGTAIMKGSKLVDRITPEETLVYNVYRGQFQGGVVETAKHGTVRIINLHEKHKHSVENGHPHLDTQLNLDVTLLERKGGSDSSRLLEEVKELVKANFYHVLQKSQKQRTDILGLGQFFRGDYEMEELHDWREKMLPDLTLTLQVNITMRNRGLTK